MPTYEYRCQTCDLNFDVVQSFSEDTLAKCPTKKSGKSPAACASPGRGKVSKVFSAPGITFKGDGFYKTDSRAGASKSKSGASKSSSDDSKSADSASSSESSKTSDSSSKKTDSTKSDPKKSETTSS